jgi:hypothetical protein
MNWLEAIACTFGSLVHGMCVEIWIKKLEVWGNYVFILWDSCTPVVFLLYQVSNFFINNYF